jgi:hypothetical protein
MEGKQSVSDPRLAVHLSIVLLLLLFFLFLVLNFGAQQ